MIEDWRAYILTYFHLRDAITITTNVGHTYKGSIIEFGLEEVTIEVVFEETNVESYTFPYETIQYASPSHTLHDSVRELKEL